MISLLDLFSVVAVSAGAFFFFRRDGSAVPPEPLTRLHALAKADNLGLGLVALGLIPRADSPLAALKLIVIWALVLLSSASTGQLIGRSLSKGHK